MLAEVMHETVYRAYRRRLETWLQIPLDAPELDIHELITAGFSATSVEALCSLGALSPIARTTRSFLLLSSAHGWLTVSAKA